MKRSNLFIKLIFCVVLLVLPIRHSYSFSIGPLNIGGVGGGILDFGGGLMGKPMELLTEGAINNMHDKLQDNINHLDTVMARNAKLFTSNFDSVLKWREEQLGVVLQATVDTLNQGLSNNIVLLNQTIQNGVSGLEKVGASIDKGVYKYLKFAALLAFIIITFYFIFLSYNESKINANWTSDSFKKIFDKTKFYFAGLAVFFVLLYFLQPLVGRYDNKEYAQKLSLEETFVKTALQNYDFQNAEVKGTSLTYLANNTFYEYGLSKIKLWKNIFILMNGGQIKVGDNINNEYNTFSTLYTKYKINDPEFFLLSALFKKINFKSKEGALLASLSCFKYLQNRGNKHNDLYDMSLAPFCFDIIKKYFLNPYDTVQVRQILRKHPEETFTEKEFQKFGDDQADFSKESSNYPDSYIKQLGYKQIEEDEQLVYYKLNNTLDLEKKNKFLNDWLNNLKYIKESDEIDAMSNTALQWPDFMAHSILNGFNSSAIAKLNSDLDRQFSNSNIDLALKDALKDITPFKKEIILLRLQNQSDDISKAVHVKEMVEKCNYFYYKIDSLFTFHDQAIRYYKEDNKDSTVGAYKNCVRLSCELNLFYRRVDFPYYDKLKRPLAYFFIDELHSIINRTAGSMAVEDELKSYSEALLKKHYYN